MNIRNIKIIKVLNTYRNKLKEKKIREHRINRLINRSLDELHGLKFTESFLAYQEDGYDFINEQVRVIEKRLKISRRLSRLNRLKLEMQVQGLIKN